MCDKRHQIFGTLVMSGRESGGYNCYCVSGIKCKQCSYISHVSSPSYTNLGCQVYSKVLFSPL